MHDMHGHFENSLRGLALALLIGGIGLAVYRIAFDPAATVVLPDARAPWIAAPAPVTARIHQWRHEKVPSHRFFAFFEASKSSDPVSLRLRALGEVTVFLNGQQVGDPPVSATVPRPPPDWKQGREIDVASFLQSGRNAISVTVRNAKGPALLSLRIEGRGFELATGPHWLTAVDRGRPQAAWLADDVRPHVSADAGEEPLAAMAQQAGSLLLLFALGALGFGSWQRFADPEAERRLATLMWVGVLAGWGILFVGVFLQIDTRVGFDAASHLSYVSKLWSGGGIPLATDGFATYHPPLFYAVSGAVATLVESLGFSRALGLKWIPFCAGLALVWIAWALARRLFPEDAPLRRTALLFAALLPMNLYIAAYFTNEGLHAALAAAALFWAVDLLLRDRFSAGRMAVFSVLVGLALLTKFSALLVAGAAGGALALRVMLDGRSAGGGRAVGLAALLLPALLISGWFYARNVALFGQPLMGNWHFREPGMVWWSEPGFHTPAYYLSFGTALSRPFLASFSSFWDALYSTLWGDGLLAGQGGLGARHRFWNYSFMAAGYALALPATGLGALGFVRGLGFALGDPEPRRRAAFALLAGVSLLAGFAIFWLTLALPYFGQARAFYALMLTPALALYFALGFGAFDGWLGRWGGTPARALLYGWMAAFFGVLYLSYAS